MKGASNLGSQDGALCSQVHISLELPSVRSVDDVHPNGEQSMQTWWLTTLGLVAGLCTSLSFVPQVLKAWREGDTEAISKRMYVASLIAYGLWIVHGLMITSVPIM